MLNVSNAQIGKIENIKHNAIPDVEEAVKSGGMSISTANEVAKLAPEQQEQIIKEKPNITHKEVKEIQKSTPPKPKVEIAPEIKEVKEPTEVETAPEVKEVKEIEKPTEKADDTADTEIKTTTKVEQIVKKPSPCTLSEEETAALGKYIDPLLALVDEEDEIIIRRIADRL